MKLYPENSTTKFSDVKDPTLIHQKWIEINAQKFASHWETQTQLSNGIESSIYFNKNKEKKLFLGIQQQQIRKISGSNRIKTFINPVFFDDKEIKHAFLENITQILPKWVSHCVYNKNETLVHIYLKNLSAFLTFMKYHINTQFKMMVDVTTIDYPSRIYRFVLVYNLLSVYFNSRVIIKTSLQMGDSCDSVTKLYSSANWWEREAYDMFGIKFDNHPDLRRILTDYNFSGHPLKKDHPLHGVEEARYKDPEKRVIIQTSEMAQELRQLSPNSSWEQIPKV